MAKSIGLVSLSLCNVCAGKSATFVSSISLCSALVCPRHEIAGRVKHGCEFGTIEGQDNSVRGWLLARCEADV